MMMAVNLNVRMMTLEIMKTLLMMITIHSKFMMMMLRLF